jgi:methyl-accepting chemotaxis protein
MGSKTIIQAKLIHVFFVFILFHVALNVHAEQSVSEQAQNRKSDSVVALTMQNIAGNIDKRISSMKMLANTIANDAHIQQWVNNGYAQAGENTLLKKLGYLVNEYGLTSASFADTNSNKYWNHEGFLRVLVPEIDTWYFAYLKSEEQNLISVYHDQNKKRVDLYVNYRQDNGNGLSGIATSFEGVVNMLAKSSLNEHGKLFIVDSTGKIQVHHDPKVAGKVTLQQLYSEASANTLLTTQPFNYVDSTTSNKRYLLSSYLVSSYIPSMNWFVVAQVQGELY